ncbi:transcription cofactor vestigial-like protein 3 [Dunckerocampus dactyliophorus]|uniref:transcription cofactor vestigial-like protein 3 n=1 Tax=Dunckerocampus dactyliophorus TaxID=161453 RepID=UPI002405A26F|nr:transcription cofactor vestigial-like protein 3 [Dunckerocampus dactyliophorus]
MSCLDVMYHQSYGAHLLPAEAYRSTYYNHHHQQQQRRLSAHTKMHNCSNHQQAGGRVLPSRDQGLRHGHGTESGCVSIPDLELKDGTQPAEAEYLNSRCILFTYFQGDIGDVVDEHFSRALSQSAGLHRETKPIRMSQPSVSSNTHTWKDGESLPEGQNCSVWNNTYPSHPTTCLPSVSVHPEFSSSPISLNHADGGLWAGHVLSQASLQPLATLTDSWTYSLNPQNTSGYPNVHDVYHPHPHIHARHHHHHHHHPMFHSYPSHGAALDSRFSPLLLPGVRNQSQPSASAGSSPHSEGAKTELEASNTSPVTASSVSWTPSPLHGSLELYDSVHEQTKAKSSVWF